MEPDVKNIALRDHQRLIVETPFDDLISVESIEHIAVDRKLRTRKYRVHQVQLIDLIAVISQRQRVGIALLIELPRGVQQKIRDGLIVVRLFQDARQGRRGDTIAPSLVVELPVRAGTHGDSLAVGSNTSLDHRRAASERGDVETGLPPIVGNTVRQPASAVRQHIGTRAGRTFNGAQHGPQRATYEIARAHPSSLARLEMSRRRSRTRSSMSLPGLITTARL